MFQQARDCCEPRNNKVLKILPELLAEILVGQISNLPLCDCKVGTNEIVPRYRNANMMVFDKWVM